MVRILKPNDYQGQLGLAGTNIQRNKDEVFIVNGHVELLSESFASGFNFDKIGDTNILIGPYP